LSLFKSDGLSSRRKGIALISLATLCFAALDATAKWLVRELPPIEVAALRFATHAVLMGALLAPQFGASIFHMKKRRLQLLRGAMLASMTGLNFWALQHLQLAETGAIQFSVPILIALLSAWMLREHLSWQRWAAIAAGFVGVLLVLRPGSHAFHPALVLSLVNALLYAAFNLLTRHLSATETPHALQMVSGTVAAAVLMPFAVLHWQWPSSPGTWALVVLTGLFGGLGHWCVALAHRHASAAVLGPFLYQQMIYMVLGGWLVFAQVPDTLVVVGALVVVGSGLYLLWLETRRG
jgi:drug/metabolite transporter (DMT)-like permease